MSDDKGYENLIKDLSDLLEEAKAYEFDDFKNNKYPFPKMELRNKLLSLMDNVVKGRYD